MIAIIDYSMGNIASVKNALTFLKVESILTRDSSEIRRASGIILPGVGSFRKAMKNLTEYNLLAVLNEVVLEKKTPVLGICLGMQLFADRGTEEAAPGTFTQGLGWIPGEVVKLERESPYSIPHLGFNEVSISRPHDLLKNLAHEPHFYFLHSYQFKAAHQENILGVCDYAGEITVMVAHENIFGVQFHPEKSQGVGLKIIENFIGLTKHA